jgi:hypothetical protein
MSCLGIDIGIKTLAMCVMSCDSVVCMWDTFNLIDHTENYCIKCQRKAKYTACGIFYCGIHCRKIKEKKVLKDKKISSYTTHDLTIKIVKSFKEILNTHKEILLTVNKVVLELQPKINQKMKYTSHVLFTLLTEFYVDTKCYIKFERASVKLKKIKDKSTLPNTYKNRKNRSIEYVKKCLENSVNQEYINVISHKKKIDDLCDSFLLSYNNIQLKEK